MTPLHRGYNGSLGYLSGGEDHFTQVQRGNIFGQSGVDMWGTDKPAYGKNGTYGAYTYSAEISAIIQAHDQATPLFMYIATQVMHAPFQTTAEFQSLFPNTTYTPNYAVYNGMGAAADGMFANTTQALREKDMWGNTLVVMSSDNGGPVAKVSSGGNSNNYPLRGGKLTEFEVSARLSLALASPVSWLPALPCAEHVGAHGVVERVLAALHISKSSPCDLTTLGTHALWDRVGSAWPPLCQVGSSRPKSEANRATATYTCAIGTPRCCHSLGLTPWAPRTRRGCPLWTASTCGRTSPAT